MEFIRPRGGSPPLRADSDVRFEARVTDFVEGNLCANADAESVVWSSSIDGELGVGCGILAQLSPGQVHQIKVTATNAASMSTERIMSVEVEQQVGVFTSILSPQAGPVQADLMLEGQASTSTGTIEGYRWFSSKDGFLGTGASLPVKLSIGKHELRLIALGSGGYGGRTKHNVTVLPGPEGTKGAVILAPTSGVSYGGQGNRLRGYIYDETGSLVAESRLTWSSNVSGPLGAGSEVSGVQLSTGAHQIALIDSQDPNVMAVAEINVAEAPGSVRITQPASNLKIDLGQALNLNAEVTNELGQVVPEASVSWSLLDGAPVPRGYCCRWGITPFLPPLLGVRMK